MSEITELKGRILALEALLTEFMIRFPREVAEGAIKSALPGLQRQPQDVGAYTTLLAAAINRRLPPA